MDRFEVVISQYLWLYGSKAWALATKKFYLDFIPHPESSITFHSEKQGEYKVEGLTHNLDLNEHHVHLEPLFGDEEALSLEAEDRRHNGWEIDENPKTDDPDVSTGEEDEED